MADLSALSDAELDALIAASEPTSTTPLMSMAPAAPAPGQLQSLLQGPIVRAPTDIELGVAQLRAADPTQQLMADIQGRKLLLGESASFGLLPKGQALSESLYNTLWGENPIEYFKKYTTEQDIAKEFVRQKELEAGNTLAGITYPELAGALISPTGAIGGATKVAKNAPLVTALMTRAGNVAKAGAIGGAGSGLQTFLSTPGSIDERLAAAGQSAKAGATISGLLGGAGQTLASVEPKLSSFGASARRSAFGATTSDYLKSARKQNFVKTADGVETLTEHGLDNVIAKGYAGDSLNGAQQLDALNQNIEKVENVIDGTIAKVEASGTKTDAPSFQNIIDKIENGKGYPVEVQDAYLKRVADIKEKLQTRSAGRLSYLQEQKKAVGKAYDPKGASVEAMFNRDVYHALQAEIEKYAPEVKGLNQEVQSMLLARPIAARNAAKASADAGATFEQIRKAGYTTGGLGAWWASGDPLIGLASALGLKAASSKSVRDVAGRALLSAPNLSDALNAAAPNVGIGLSRPRAELLFGNPVSKSSDASSDTRSVSDLSDEELDALIKTTEPTSLETPVIKQDISALIDSKPPIVKAIAWQESRFNPKAVSEVGAQGLMQLMPKTAKSLGVSDPFNPTENLDAGERYYNQLLKRFKKPELALAAYNWGEGNLSKALNRLRKSELALTWDNVLQHSVVPKQTKLYVKSVLSKAKEFEV